MPRSHTTEMSALRHSTHDLSNSKYQVGTIIASVQGTPMDHWLYASSSLLLSHHLWSRNCRCNGDGRQSLIPFHSVLLSSRLVASLYPSRMKIIRCIDLQLSGFCLVFVELVSYIGRSTNGRWRIQVPIFKLNFYIL